MALCKITETPPIAYTCHHSERDWMCPRPHGVPVLAIGVPRVCYDAADGNGIKKSLRCRLISNQKKVERLDIEQSDAQLKSFLIKKLYERI